MPVNVAERKGARLRTVEPLAVVRTVGVHARGLFPRFVKLAFTLCGA
jgi:hypothetical protein